MSKIFVIRINSLLSSEDSTLRFGSDNEVVIPLAVIDELQSYHGKREKREIADKILQYLESFDTRKLMSEGVRQSNGSILKVAKNYHDEKIQMEEGITETDKRVFQVCVGLQRDNPNRKVILVSKNRALRLKARALGINAEDFKDDLFPELNEQYTGRVEVQVTSRDIDYFFKEKYLPISKVIDKMNIEWIVNMFTEIHAIDNNQVGLGRYDGEKIVPFLFEPNSYPSGIRAKNVGQKMLLESLLTDWSKAPLVIAKGGAGTGKTYCSLAVALQGIDEGNYSRILVATPSETIGNEKLGFLPGDMRDKISPYLGGIKDNLALLINASKDDFDKKKGQNLETGLYYFEKGLIEVQPIGFLRGRTITDTLFIIDETQNIDPGDIKSIITRAAEGSKFVFLGDPTQVDNPKLNERYNGLVYLSEKMKGQKLCWQVSLKGTESVRSELSTVASKIL